MKLEIHYSSETLKSLPARPDGYWLGGNHLNFSRRHGGTIPNVLGFDPAKLKLANLGQATAAGLYRGNVAAMVAALKKRGFAGVKINKDGEVLFNVFDEENITLFAGLTHVPGACCASKLCGELAFKVEKNRGEK